MTPFEHFQQDFSGKRVLIFGLGLQGRGAGDAKTMAQIGARVTVIDSKSPEQLAPSLSLLKDYPITYRFGPHRPEDITGAEAILRNPSVPWNHPLLELARQRHIPVHMDEALFFSYARPARAIGVTGSRGKSTTTTLIHHCLAHSGQPALLAGNISPQASLELLRGYDPETWYVFELSSWQLQAFPAARISPHIAVVTNLYPDHLLDRDFDAYIEDKAAIFGFQTPSDLLFLNGRQSRLRQLAQSAASRKIFFTPGDLPPDLITPELKLKGRHNSENLAAAYQVARVVGGLAPEAIAAALKTYQPLPFRLEPIASKNGITVINDTTSTTPTSLLTALETYPGSILIAGGSSKHLPVAQLGRAIRRNPRHLILLSGSGTEELKPYLGDRVTAEYADLQPAVDHAFSLAGPGDTILFSPGFTSFGLFENEFDRGRRFNQIVAAKV